MAIEKNVLEFTVDGPVEELEAGVAGARVIDLADEAEPTDEGLLLGEVPAPVVGQGRPRAGREELGAGQCLHLDAGGLLAEEREGVEVLNDALVECGRAAGLVVSEVEFGLRGACEDGVEVVVRVVAQEGSRGGPRVVSGDFRGIGGDGKPEGAVGGRTGAPARAGAAPAASASATPATAATTAPSPAPGAAAGAYVVVDPEGE